MADQRAGLEDRLRALSDNWFRNGLLGFAFQAGLKMAQLVIGGLAIIWLSVLVYILFYYKYIPTVMNTREVHLQYDSRCDPNSGHCCGIPYAEVPFRPYDFDRGQAYRFILDMRLPESDVNWSQGMFMVRLKIIDQKNRTVVNIARPTGLKYKSLILRTIHILFFWPLMLLGLVDESQHISLILMEDYVEGSYAGAVGPYTARLEFEVRDVHIYPPTHLRVGAALTGLAYYMYHYWPLTFIMGTTTISSFLYICTLIMFTNQYRRRQREEELTNDEEDNDNDSPQAIARNVRQIDADTSGLTGDIDEELEREIAEQEVVRHMEELDKLAEESEQMVNSAEQEVEVSSNESDVSSTVVIQEADETMT